MEDPFGDPFADEVAPVVKKATPKPAAKPAPKPAPKPVVVAPVAKPVVVEPTPVTPPAPAKTTTPPPPPAVPVVKSTPTPPPAAPVEVPAPKPASPIAADDDDDLFASYHAAPVRVPSPAVAIAAAAAAAAAVNEEEETNTTNPESTDVSAAATTLAATTLAAAPVEEPVDTAATTPATNGVSPAVAALAATYVDLDDEEAADELSLEDQSLTEFPADVIRARGAELRRIDLTSNRFTSLSSLAWPFGLPAWPQLTELILDKNQLSGLDGLGQIPSLTTLWINNNRVADLDAMLDAIVRLCPNLTYLSIMRNPACPDAYFSDGEMESYGRFRLYVIYRLKNLQFLDSTEVTPAERKEATLRGAYCRVAKPQAPKTKGKAAPVEEEVTTPTVRQSQVGFDQNQQKPPKVASFLAKGKPRYDGTNSEGNRFIMNDDL